MGRFVIFFSVGCRASWLDLEWSSRWTRPTLRGFPLLLAERELDWGFHVLEPKVPFDFAVIDFPHVALSHLSSAWFVSFASRYIIGSIHRAIDTGDRESRLSGSPRSSGENERGLTSQAAGCCQKTASCGPFSGPIKARLPTDVCGTPVFCSLPRTSPIGEWVLQLEKA
ncbi:hypothetical protein VTI74DRAFT_7118 [Chaetomium olivicolor]